MRRRKTFSVIIESLFQSIVDTCILPGTANSTEILWLYTKQWRHELTILVMAIITLLSTMESSQDVNIHKHQTVIEPDNQVR